MVTRLVIIGVVISYLVCVAAVVANANSNRDRIIKIVIHLESRGNETAHNLREDAVGVLQIRQIMVRELNRIAKYEKYSLEDRWNPEMSIMMFIDFQNKYNPNWDEEMACRLWNGGGKGMQKESTIGYYNNYLKIKEELK